jgi:CxxC motif-containing protein
MKELVCIVCPNSCRLSIEQNGSSFTVRGNQCRRGETFAHDEMTNPVRTLTTTVRTALSIPVLPVRSLRDIPKAKVKDVMRLLASVTITEPVGIGEIVVKNVLGLGVDIVAASNALKENAGSEKN